jgi:glutathione S-transferase
MTVAARTKPKPKTSAKAPKAHTATASLTLSSKNYSSWSLRGWLLARFAGLDFEEVMVSPDDADARKELLLLAPSILVPCLTHEGTKSWNVMAIAYYLDEIKPGAGLLPANRAARAHCRSICGEMNSGFANLRASLPMNLKGHFPQHTVWAGRLKRERLMHAAAQQNSCARPACWTRRAPASPTSNRPTRRGAATACAISSSTRISACRKRPTAA